MAPTNYRFADKIIHSQFVIISRRHVFAMVYQPGGHVVVCPTRVVPKLVEMTEIETLELFVCAKEISKRFEDKFNFKNISFLIQDGDSAGS
jgi:bis(5'-adenosyl)-triphosphatase